MEFNLIIHNKILLMKKTFLTLLALLGGVYASTAALTALHIHTSSQGIITLLLDDEPVLNFNEDRSITIEVPNNSEFEPVSITFDEVESCEYGDVTDYKEESVASPIAPTSSVIVNFDAENVRFSGITETLEAEIYSVSGIKTLSLPVADGEVVLHRGILPRGVYIVRIGTFVTKITF